MRLLLCLVLPIAAWCAPAALAKNDEIADESLKPLLRVKRADEKIMFGNHQNNAQFVKKADPDVPLNNDEDDIDKKATIEVDTNTSKDDDVSADLDNVKADNDADANAVTENEMDDSETSDESKTQDLTEEEEAAEEFSGEDSSEKNTEEKPDENYYYQYYSRYPTIYRQKRGQAERSAQQMTAENMSPVDGVQAGVRSKRDLTADDIYQWLETGEGPRDYYPEYEVPAATEYDNGLENLALAKLMEEYGDGNELGYDQDYPEYTDYTDPQADFTNKELMEYLLEYLAANEIPEESPISGIYPNDIQEEWEEVNEEPEESLPYEPIIYNGVPGIFIPMSQESRVSKREYFNLDSGLRKRNDFYPYSMEPEDGRWGAFVDKQEEKRNADAYERLLRMAEALNPPEERYFDEFGYKK